MAANGNVPLSSLGATLNEAVIPLVPKIKTEDLEQAALIVYRPVGQGNNIHHEKKKALVPKCLEEDPESLLRTVVSFFDACDNARLHLSTGPLRYEKFRECLGGNILDTWDAVSTGTPNTVAGFQTAVENLIAQYLVPTAQSDQAQYLQNCRKPFRLSCFQLGGRLGFINKLMSWFPGNGGNVPFNDAALTNMFYRMMLEDWKLNFLSSGRDINTLTFLDMQRYMSNQELAGRAKARRQQAKQQQSTGKRSFYPQQGRGNYQPFRGGMRFAGRRRIDHGGGRSSYGYSSNSQYSGSGQGRGFGSGGGRGFSRGGGRFGSGRGSGRSTGRSGGRGPSSFRQQNAPSSQARQDQYHMDSTQPSPSPRREYEERTSDESYLGDNQDQYYSEQPYEQDQYYADEDYQGQDQDMYYQDNQEQEYQGEDQYFNEDQGGEGHWMDHLEF